MQSSRSVAFEVYCDRCRVSFPVGTRRCVHCGGPTTPSRAAAGLRASPAAEPGAPEEAEVELEPELGRQRFVSPMTLAWIALIAAGYLYRACAGQSP